VLVGGYQKSTGQTLNGRLLAKSNESTELNPKWLVTFTNKAWEDQEAYESSFVVEGNSNSDLFDTTMLESNGHGGGDNNMMGEATSISTTAVETSESLILPNPLPVSEEEGDLLDESMEDSSSVVDASSVVVVAAPSPPQRKTVTFDDSSSTSSSAGQGTTKNASVTTNAVASSRKRATAVRRHRPNRRKVPAPAAAPRKTRATVATLPSAAAAAPSNEEVVVRVPMLTGTLLLYKGANPRAEFVRRL
jgi:hypothetical protein